MLHGFGLLLHVNIKKQKTNTHHFLTLFALFMVHYDMEIKRNSRSHPTVDISQRCLFISTWPLGMKVTPSDSNRGR